MSPSSLQAKPHIKSALAGALLKYLSMQVHVLSTCISHAMLGMAEQWRHAMLRLVQQLQQ